MMHKLKKIQELYFKHKRRIDEVVSLTGKIMFWSFGLIFVIQFFPELFNALFKGIELAYDGKSIPVDINLFIKVMQFYLITIYPLYFVYLLTRVALFRNIQPTRLLIMVSHWISKLSIVFFLSVPFSIKVEVAIIIGVIIVQYIQFKVDKHINGKTYCIPMEQIDFTGVDKNSGFSILAKAYQWQAVVSRPNQPIISEIKIHEVKTEHQFFEQSLAGYKDWEVRLDDRNYEIGDYLKQWEVLAGELTGRFRTSRILNKVIYPELLKENVCILSLASLEKSEVKL